MKRSLLPVVFVAVAALIASAANAQATRTWVSGVGDDVNPCSRTAPCKTFAGAISKTAAGGEISVLDPGGFGAITITKAITINGDGQIAGITHGLTNGVIVNAGVNDVIVLRNLAINGTGTGINGVRFLAGRVLMLDNVTISGFTTRGVDMQVTSGNRRLILRDTRITRGATGLFASTTVGIAEVTIENSSFSGLTNGVDGGNNSRISITRSSISNNTSNGVLASNGTARINVDSSQISMNELSGVNASVSGSIIRIANNEIYNNNAGVSIAAGAVVESDGSNRVAGNASSAAPNGVLPNQ